MPGINVVLGSPALVEQALRAAQTYTDQIKGHFPHWQTRIAFQNPVLCCFLTSHAAYHIGSLETADWCIAWEHPSAPALPVIDDGIYTKLTTCASAIAVKTVLSPILSRCRDGFLLVMYHKPSQSLYVANDRLARLPAYYAATRDGFLLGRDFPFIVSCLPNLKPDKLFLALYGSFSYIPGRGSYYQEIDTLAPDTYGLYQLPDQRLDITSDPSQRLPATCYGKSYKSGLTDLVDSFLAATSYQAKGKDLWLALSGGLDSRAVAAALSRLNIAYQAVTYRDADGTAEKDIPVAQTIAKSVSCPHQIVDLPCDTQADLQALFALKRGLNYLGVAFLGRFLAAARSVLPGAHLLLTGDGGDKVLPDLLPERKLTSLADLIQYILDKQTVLPPAQVAGWFGINRAEINAYLERLLAAYPVDSLEDKYRFFLLSERAGRWLFEGEDRNRAYFQSDTPFYDSEFYQLALSLPVNWKQHMRLYHHFLQLLNPHLSRIRNANYRLNPYSPLYKPAQAILSLFRKTSASGQAKASNQTQVPVVTARQLLQESITRNLQAEQARDILASTALSDIPVFLQNAYRSQLYLTDTLLRIVTADNQ